MNEPQSDCIEVVLQVAANPDRAPSVAEVREWSAAAIQASAARRDDKVGVTVRLVSEEEGESLNARFRGIPEATNVLAFPSGAAVVPAGSSPDELGDLAICMPVVLREAAEQSKQPQYHLAHMVIHGILHLLGYDHVDAADAVRMEACEQAAMQLLGYPNPYAGDLSDVGHVE